MNRRNLIKTMLGVAAATALPSEIWPFRKILLPAAAKPWARIVGPRDFNAALMSKDYYSIQWPVVTRQWTFGTYVPEIHKFLAPDGAGRTGRSPLILTDDRPHDTDPPVRAGEKEMICLT